MGTKIRLVSALFVVILLFVNGGTQVYAADSIRVTGYGAERTKYPIADQYGGPPPGFYFNIMSGLYNRIKSPGNFGSEGIVKCAVSNLDSLTDYVAKNSLVQDDGTLLYDVFFAPVLFSVLSDEEVTELANYVRRGGVLFVAEEGSSIPGFSSVSKFNPLFSKLGMSDIFRDTMYPSVNIVQSETPQKSIVTDGAFGVVGPLSHSSFRLFNETSLQRIISTTESDGIVFESKVDSGYLIVSGYSLFVNGAIADADNSRYMLNLFALGCDKSWQDNAVVLDVPSFKQGLAPFDDGDPYWEDTTYDNGNELDLWCDTDKNGTDMSECACALTSANMVMRYLGFDKTPLGVDLDPAYLNIYAEEILQNGGHAGFVNGNFRWDFLGNFSVFAKQFYPDQPKIEQPVRENFSIDRVKALIDEHKPVIVRVNNGSHWVVVKGYDPDTNRLIINDPAFPDPITGEYQYMDEHYTPDLLGSMIIYTTANSDYRYLQFATDSHNHLLVVDSAGRKTGFDVSSNQELEEIPDSGYALDPYYSLGVPTEEGVRFLTIKLPADGEYFLQIQPRDSEIHPVTIYSSDIEGNYASKQITDTSFEYKVDYSEISSGDDIKLSIPAEIDAVPYSSKNIIVPHRWIPAPVALLATELFDVRKVNKDSLTFGKTGDEQSLLSCSKKLWDVNRDRRPDLICYFAGDKLNLDLQDTLAFLKGEYEGGLSFEAHDQVRVIKPWFLF